MKRALAAVLLAGCWTSSAPPSTPEPAPAPAAAPRAPREEPAPLPLDTDDKEIDDALAGAPTHQTAKCPSGIGITGRFINLSVQGNATIGTIFGGRDDGVEARWTVVHPPHGCVILRVEKKRTVLSCSATMDQLKAAASALLCSP